MVAQNVMLKQDSGFFVVAQRLPLLSCMHASIDAAARSS